MSLTIADTTNSDNISKISSDEVMVDENSISMRKREKIAVRQTLSFIDDYSIPSKDKRNKSSRHSTHHSASLRRADGKDDFTNELDVDASRKRSSVNSLRQSKRGKERSVSEDAGGLMAAPPPYYHDIRVLIADDASSNRKMLSRLLKIRFGEVHEAVDGLDAVSQLRSRLESGEPAFDVILMDNMMPNMDGPTATRAMRDMGYEGLIIGVTGHAMPAEVQDFLNHGANLVLTKPMDMKVFDDYFRGESSLLKSVRRAGSML